MEWGGGEKGGGREEVVEKSGKDAANGKEPTPR